MKIVSVVMPCFNSGRTIEACLRSLKEQDYRGKVEIIVADGGSKDGTVKVLKQYGCKVIKEKTGSPESAKAVALKQAKGELVLLMASDNVLVGKSWLKQMVKALEAEPKAVASYPWRYGLRKQDTSLNRYFALMGGNDPVALFMGKADRQAHGSDKWGLKGKAEDKGDYWLVEFNKNNMPTLGDNGVLVRRKWLLKAKVDEKNFFHIDVFWDLVEQGFNQFVVVKNEIVHDTGERFFGFTKKRYRYMKELYLKDLKLRRFVWVRDWFDKLKIFAYIIYSITLIGPLLEAFKGWRVKKDLAWFWHPVMSLAMVFVYGLALVMRLIG